MNNAALLEQCDPNTLIEDPKWRAAFQNFLSRGDDKFWASAGIARTSDSTPVTPTPRKQPQTLRCPVAQAADEFFTKRKVLHKASLLKALAALRGGTKLWNRCPADLKQTWDGRGIVYGYDGPNQEDRIRYLLEAERRLQANETLVACARRLNALILWNETYSYVYNRTEQRKTKSLQWLEDRMAISVQEIKMARWKAERLVTAVERVGLGVIAVMGPSSNIWDSTKLRIRDIQHIFDFCAQQIPQEVEIIYKLTPAVIAALEAGFQRCGATCTEKLKVKLWGNGFGGCLGNKPADCDGNEHDNHNNSNNDGAVSREGSCVRQNQGPVDLDALMLPSATDDLMMDSWDDGMLSLTCSSVHDDNQLIDYPPLDFTT